MEFIFKESISINGIKGKHLSQGRINSPADGLSKIDRMMEHIFNKRKKILLEAYKQRRIRNLLETTEITKFLRQIMMNIIYVCTKCNFKNPQGSIYCQHCGNKLKKKAFFSTDANQSKKIFFAGMGNKGSSIAPLGGMAIQNQAKQFSDYKQKKSFPKIKIIPLEDGSWYCPLCGDKNKERFCKGCGIDFSL